MLPIIACPRCSAPRANVFARAICHKGRASGRWMLVAPGSCDHIDLFAAWNSSAEPDPLITHWNEQAEKMAAEVSTERGYTPDQATDFLASLRQKTYRADGILP